MHRFKLLALSLALSSVSYADTAPIQPPITLLDSDSTYTVRADGTFDHDEVSDERLNTAEAVQKHGQYYKAYNSSFETVEVIEAYTLTKDGQKINVPKDKIFTQQSPISTQAPSFGDIKIRAIVFPAMEVGATQHLHIRATHFKPLFAHRFSLVKSAQDDIEIKSAVIHLNAPKSMPLFIQNKDFQGGEVTSNDPAKNAWVWQLKDHPYAPREVGSVSPEDYNPLLAVTSIPNVDDAAKAYLEGAQDKAKVTPKVQKLADSLTTGINDPLQQAKALYNWTSQHIRYVAIDIGQGGVVPHAADSIIDAGYGDCKDHAVLLGALLAAKGIQSAPVLVNLSNAYEHLDVAAVPGLFNHVITYIPQFDIYVDSTAAMTTFGVLAPTEYGKTALLTHAQDGLAKLVTLPIQSKEGFSLIQSKVTLDENGELKGQSTIAVAGLEEFISRATFSLVQPGTEPQVASQIQTMFGQQGSGDLKKDSDPRDLNQHFSYQTSFDLPDYSLLAATGTIKIPTITLEMSSIASIPRSAPLPSRTHAAMCLATNLKEETDFSLPKGIAIQSLPAPVKFSNEISSYSASYTQVNPSLIHIQRQLILTPKSLPCDPAEYSQIRQLSRSITHDLQAEVSYTK